MEQLLPWLGPLGAIGTLIFTIYSTRSKANTQKVTDIERRVDRTEDRLTKIESDMRHLPDKDSTHRMELAILELKADVRVIGERLEPVANISDRLQEFLLEQANRA